MATVFKHFLANDITQTRTLLNEAVPITGSLLSASYGTHPNENNIKNFSHQMFQQVYDYAYLSGSANYLFDITMGYANSSAMSSSTNIQNDKKINIYTQMAQTLMGFDITGSVNLFDEDGNILAGGTKIKEAIFINFSRLLVKDEIKKGSVSLQFGKNAYETANNSLVTIVDAGAETDYKVNSPIGEYGILSMSSGQAAGSTSGLCGLVFYQAGVMVLTASIFMTQPVGKIASSVTMTGDTQRVVGGGNMNALMTGSNITGSADALRHRIYNMSFVNTTELNSTIYFCRLDPNEFNYSSNPSYLTGSRIRVKQNSFDIPNAYITTIGLYSSDNALLGVAKVSEPLKKTPDNSLTLRCRLDY